MSFTQQDPVTSLSFRTDGFSILASGNMHGQVNLWHLERKKLITVLKVRYMANARIVTDPTQDIHDGPVLSLRFFPGEPVLLSSGNDNSLKMWLFEFTEAETGAATHRLLRSRSGHAKPPHCTCSPFRLAPELFSSAVLHSAVFWCLQLIPS